MTESLMHSDPATNANSAKQVSAIVLAAGLSSRMGSENKLHLPVNGEALLRHGIQRFIKSGIEEIIVVLGHEHEETAQLINDLNIKIVINQDYSQGQITSVRTGLAAVSKGSEATFIALGDQPAVSADSIKRILTGFEMRRHCEVIVPYFNGDRGNPILISAKSRNKILSGEHNFGCRKFIDKNPNLVYRVNVTDAGVTTDLDTPQDYQHYCDSAFASAPCQTVEQ